MRGWGGGFDSLRQVYSVLQTGHLYFIIISPSLNCISNLLVIMAKYSLPMPHMLAACLGTLALCIAVQGQYLIFPRLDDSS